jgi:hypothetical protein
VYVVGTIAWYPLELGEGQMDQDEPRTLSVPEAGKRYFGLSRNGSYRAAERGDIPTIQVGRLLRVPVVRMEKKLAGKEGK